MLTLLLLAACSGKVADDPHEAPDKDGDRVPADRDCDDMDPHTYPGAAPLDSVAACMTDADGDDYGSTTAPRGGSAGRDCDDDNPAAYPGAAFLESTTDCMIDSDGDGYGAARTKPGVLAGTDCDDDDPAAYPGAEEIMANGIDDDCDGKELCYYDEDGDGWGSADHSPIVSSDLDCLDGREATTGTDCHDSDADTYPGAAPLDSKTDCMTDEDGDGYGAELVSDGQVAGTDCDDGDASWNTDCYPLGSWSLSEADAKLVGRYGFQDNDRSVSGVGDVDGDGLDDILVGAHGYGGDGENWGFDSSGVASLFRGPVVGTLDLTEADAVFLSERDSDTASRSIAGAGDVDGDGFDDLLIGGDGVTWDGVTYLVLGPVSGAVELSAADARLVGERAHSGSGSTVAGAGDVDGDGHADLLIGAWSYGYASYCGNCTAYLVFGPVAGTVDLAAADAMFIGSNARDEVGKTLSTAGDMDGDGIHEFLIGAPRIRNAGYGRVYVVNGTVRGTVELSDATAELATDAYGDRAGASIAGAGDVDGDGLDDILIGAPLGGDPFYAGLTYLVHGPVAGTLMLIDAAAARFEGVYQGELSGSSVAGAGDVDGDGRADVIIGAPSNNIGGPDAGVAYLVLNPAPGTWRLSRADARFVGESRYDRAGSSVAGAGDVDGDGLDDLLVGAFDNFGGAAYVIYAGGL